MTALTLLSTQPLIHAFGWTLLNFLWQGAIIALVLKLVLRLLIGNSSQLRYMAACCALGLMVVFPLATFGHLAANSKVVSQALSRSNVERDQVPSLRSDSTGPVTPWVDQIAEAFDNSLPWLLAAWLAGATILMGRLNIGLIIAWKMKSVSTELAPVELQAIFNDLSNRIGIVRQAALLNSALVQVPTVIGWLRPAVLIPVGCLTGLSPTQIEAIFAHELAHIRRHDYLVSVFQSLVESVLFYHPAVWWVSKRVRQEREDCCDDLAVRISGDSLAYARALSFLEEHRSSHTVVALGANGGVLAMRIRRLLGYKDAPAYSWLAAITQLAVVVVAAALCIGTFTRAQARPDKPLTQDSNVASHSSNPVYQRWLDEDVLWIIAPVERAAFTHLSSDPERDEFIRQFWSRRDSGSVGAGENSARREHYRRLAYSSEHFTAGMPGWKSDRGRIYILYGPPNSIEAHPVGSSTTEPYEVWHYLVIQKQAQPEHGQDTLEYKARSITKKDVDITFVDVCNCGNYQLDPVP
jgi:GWxTD domain-containing protein